jgi:flagellar hook-basal body complex protein FliE
MPVNFGSVAAAYARNAGTGTVPGMEPRAKDPAQSFADMVGDAVHGAIATGKNAETMSAKAIAGTADLREVVTAVTNAEVTLQTALAIRDKVVQAYQEILSMPI